MDIKLLARGKLENFENRKSEIITSDVENEYISKIKWLRNIIQKNETVPPESEMKETSDLEVPEVESLIIRIKREKLKNLLTEKFNRDDLRALCFNLGIDWENFSSEGKQALIIELIQSLERSKELLKLLFELPKYNSSITWQDFDATRD